MDPLSYTELELSPDFVQPLSHYKRASLSGSSTGVVPGAAVEKRKSRQKPKIELAPDQPTTTQGKQRKRVYVACLQCRTRKIRCDGTKPACYNCTHRTTSTGECNYDTVPRRRGPDKTPGARQRMGRDNLDITASTGVRRRRTRRPESEPIAEPAPVPTFHSPSSSGSGSGSEYLQSPIIAPYQQQEQYNLDHHHHYQHAVDNHVYQQQQQQQQLSHQLQVSLYPQGQAQGQAQAYITPIDDDPDDPDEYEPIHQQQQQQQLPNTPSSAFTKKTWFESLCSLYYHTHIDIDASYHCHALTPSQRSQAFSLITKDLKFIFGSSNYWFSFIHLPSFLGQFYSYSYTPTHPSPNHSHHTQTQTLQPSLLLSLLSLSTFFQSSELGLSAPGRTRALHLRDLAQSAFDASFASGWIDETLAQAAWILALFEVCSHPNHSSARSVGAIRVLDGVIASLALTGVDRGDGRVCVWGRGEVPGVATTTQAGCSGYEFGYEGQGQLPSPISPVGASPTGANQFSRAPNTNSHAPTHPNPNTSAGCTCHLSTLSTHCQLSLSYAPLWAQTPAWNPDWDQGEIRKESIRRLCWSASSLAAGHVSYAVAARTEWVGELGAGGGVGGAGDGGMGGAGGRRRKGLFIGDPANYALLFSGESTLSHPSFPYANTISPKESVWALYDRCFLLWNSCVKMRFSTVATPGQKADFAIKSWLEADRIEEALNRHTCGIEKAFIFQGREYLFNTRMCITYEFQRYIPMVNSEMNGMFHSRKAEEWLTHQANVAQRFMYGLHTITGNSSNLLARRPFFTLWFMAQVNRALTLWQCDQEMVLALEVCKAFLPAIDYLSALWPCSEQRKRYEKLRVELDRACRIAGVGVPPPMNLTLSLGGEV